MTESHTEDATGTWSVPQCPFAIEYSLRVLDDIRLAVMDAFFSLPRGGAEIGGVLIGRIVQGKVIVTDYQALDCEHAFGPSFQLSARDDGKLAELLSEIAASQRGAPVGWYHSHTRSEIFLSDADLAIHQHFFPEPWQVALVMKPHTFQPTRCGFFFREPGGNIQASETCKEFTLDALPMRPIPSGGLPLATDSINSGDVGIDGGGHTITVEPDRGEQSGEEAAAGAAPPAPATDPEPEPEIAPIEPPRLLMDQGQERSWRWLKVVAAIAVGAGIGVAGYQTRQAWWPKLAGMFTAGAQHRPQQATAAPVPPAIGLNTTDLDGQLQIHWDRYSQAVRRASGGRLTIQDSSAPPREIALDPSVLQTGSFTYARTSGSVMVTMALDQPGNQQAHETSSFLGAPPAPKVAPENPALRKERDALQQESAKLKQQLATQVDRNRRLQRALDEAQKQLREQARQRLATQAPK